MAQHNHRTQRSSLHPLSGYGLAAGTAALAAMARWLLPGALAPAPYLGFYPAVVISAALGGVGPGLAAAFAALILVNFVFGNFDASDYGNAVRQAVWVAASIGVTLLAGMQRAARMRERLRSEELRVWKDELEVRVEQQTAEIAQANLQLRAANGKLAELDQAKTNFFSNVSHEFRTPLTLMLGSLQEVLDDVPGGLPEFQRQRLAVAQRNAQQLLKLVSALLDFTRIEAGRAQALFEPMDLASATVQLANHFESAFAAADLALTIDCPPLPERIYADPDMWEKIVLNLISNAFKFTHSGGVTVSLSSAGGQAQLTVRDTGTGIPENELPNLFQRFHRVEGAPGRSYEGSGIGLALVRELVQLHGGTFSVESVLGQGSAFHVAIPLGTAHLQADRLREPHAPTNSAGGAEAFVSEALSWLPEADGAEAGHESPGREVSHTATGETSPAASARVLLADDNADMRAYVGRLLRRAGYDVAAVADGEQALAACLANPPDLVLTGVMMPGLDGFSLLARLRGDERTALLPVLLLSARAGEEARVEGLEAGADDYIVKPFGSRELLARVDAAVRLSRARKEAMGREAEIARLRASFEDTAVGMAHMAPDGRWLRVNNRLCAMTGYAREELLAKSSQDITHPDGLDAGLAAMRKLLAGEIRACAIEQRYCRKDGAILWINLTGTLIRNADGSPGYFLCVIDDITARKQAGIALAESRSRLAGVVDSAMDAIVSIDARQNIVLFNGAAERMFQRKAANVIGQPLGQLMPQRFQGAHAQYVAEFAETGVSSRAMGNLGTLRALRADGTEFPIETAISQTRVAGEVLLTVILRDITERKRAEDTQRLLLAELDHRVKNTLASVQAIALQTLGASTDPAEFVESFNGRLQALGRAHDLLTRSSWQGADLASLINEQLALGPADADKRISRSGPRVLLEPQAALHLGLVLHELGTNARKYGALSRPEGRLTMRWSLTGEDEETELRLEWIESDGPPVVAPAQRGFGATLIERSLRYALGGEAQLSFAPAGVTCGISLPLPQKGKGAYSAELPESAR